MKTRNERLADVVTMLGEAWRQKITPATLLTFQAGTDDIDIEAIERAAMRAIRECQFMPSVFELRQLTGMSGAIATKDRPTLAWIDVRQRIAKVGGYDSPNFLDPTINATIRSLGGWVALCDSTTEELVWREKDFLRTYAALMPLNLPDEQTARLAGITETTNGPAIPAPVVEIGCLTTGGYGQRRVTEPVESKRLPLVAAETLLKRLSVDDRDEPKEPITLPDRDTQLAALSARFKT